MTVLCLWVCATIFFPTSGIKDLVVEILEKSIIMSELMFDIERFNGKLNFNVWQSSVKNVLMQQGLLKALQGKKHVIIVRLVQCYH